MSREIIETIDGEEVVLMSDDYREDKGVEEINLILRRIRNVEKNRKLTEEEKEKKIEELKKKLAEII